MASMFKKPKKFVAPQVKPVEEPVDADGLKRARMRALQERERMGRSKTRIDLDPNALVGGDTGSGVYIP